MHASELQVWYEYLHDSRSQLLRASETLGWAEFGRDRGASWGSMLAVFLHVLDDEEGWLQYAARGRSLREGPDRKASGYSGFPALAADEGRVAAATRRFLESLTPQDLARELEISHGTGTDRRTVGKVVMHAFVDELAHLGELGGLLWQQGIEAPFIDWLDYHETHAH